MRKLLPLLLLLGAPLVLVAQQHPLTTEEVITPRPGQAIVTLGFELLQDVRFPLSGLEGDLTRAGVVDVHFGVSRAAEIQIQGTIRNFLSVNSQQAALISPRLDRGGTSTSNVGDFTLAAKVRLLPETESRPAIGIRFGFEMPNSDEARGIGLNTTNVFFTLLGQRHYGKLNLFGNLGIGILQAPAGLFSQNDVILYGLGALYPVHERINLVGEIAGRQSTRSTPSTGPLAGTGSRSQARLGFQVFAGGLRWNFAGIAGLTKNDADTGFTFGVTREIQLFPSLQTGR
ncbi:MAG: hypothetical protein ACE5IP_10115 [Terriglobia bacterium]